MGHENKSSDKGVKKYDAPHKGEGKVSSIEHVGSSGSHGVRFKMPANVVDHSCVHIPEHK